MSITDEHGTAIDGEGEYQPFDDGSTPLEPSTTSPCRNPLLLYSSIVDEADFKPFSLLWALFQVGNLILLTLFLLPSSKWILWRVLATIYSLILLLFAYFVLQSTELIVWSSIFCIINLTYFVIRVSKWRGHYSADTEQVYRKLCAPLRISRPQFSQILSCKRNTRLLHAGEKYSTEKVTRVDSLSLVLSGRLLVSQQGRPLHIILPHQFVDSPEFFGVATDEFFQVTITAVEETKLLVWHRDKLRLTIMEDEFLKIMFDHILGRDVVRKLIQVSDSATVPPSTGSRPPSVVKQTDLHASGGVGDGGSDECHPMLAASDNNVNVTSKDLDLSQLGLLNDKIYA